MKIDEITEISEAPCMTYSSTLTSKNQTTLPKAVATLLGAKPSSILAYEVLEDGKVLLTAKSATFKDIANTFPKKKPITPVSMADMKNAVLQGAVKRFKKSAK